MISISLSKTRNLKYSLKCAVLDPTPNCILLVYSLFHSPKELSPNFSLLKNISWFDPFYISVYIGFLLPW